MASIFAHKSGWRAIVTVRKKRLTGVFRTKREAQAWAAATELQLRENLRKAPAELHTVRSMLERYAERITPLKAGERAERLRIQAFLRDFAWLADKKLSEVDTPDLVAWRDARLKVVSAAAVLRDVNWLRNAFRVAREEWRWMDKNPWVGMRLPPKQPSRDRRVLPCEVRALCRVLEYRSGRPPETKQQEVALAMLIALRTGMRAGEVLQLSDATVDLTKRVATIDHHKRLHATGKPRRVPLTGKAIRLMRPLAGRGKWFSITAASLDALFRKARDRLMIKGLHFHDTRAEALTLLARRVDVLTLAKISGHKDIRMLSEVYYRESAEDIAGRL
jgi:integrase